LALVEKVTGFWLIRCWVFGLCRILNRTKKYMIAASSLSFLTMGAFFGLTAGISPGPLLTLVISETLRHNKKEGFKVAVAPLITDLPIIIITSYIFSRISQYNILLGLISILGGIYFIYLGYETLITKGLDNEIQKLKPDSLKKGITANFLNPNPYIFWLTVGMPTAFKAYQQSYLTAILFFFFFYFLLVGSKITVALLVERSKAFLKNEAYKVVMKILGISLLFFAFYFFFEGIKILKGNI
jgi:threonine/homoserine/homoserine lactone efflux protein